MSNETGQSIGEPRTISTGRFFLIVFVMVILMGMVEGLGLMIVGWVLGFRVNGGWVSGLGVLNTALAQIGLDRVLRRLGLSRSGKIVEIQGRTEAFHEERMEDDLEAVEVRPSRSFLIGFGLMGLGGCIAFALMPIYAHDMQEGIYHFGGYGLSGFFGLTSFWCVYWLCLSKPQAWADGSGVTGYPVGYSIRRRFVPWSKVSTCEFSTYYDTFGKPAIMRPTLMGQDGEVLLSVDLMMVEMKDQERLAKFIKKKLPKPKAEFWD